MSEWTKERIGRLRDLAGHVIDTDEQGESFGVLDHSAALDAFDAAVTPDAILSLLDALETAQGAGWIAPVTPETMPKAGAPVLAHFLNSHGNSRRVLAIWATAEIQMQWDDDYYDREPEDVRAGWFETAYNSEEYWPISETVTHWRPLPSPPVQP